MRLGKGVYLVGGGRLGFGLSGRWDCHVYVVEGDGDLIMIDAGLGLPGDLDRILENMQDDGLDPVHLRHLVLTHYHADHIGAASQLVGRFGVQVSTSPVAADVIEQADEETNGLAALRALGGYPPNARLTPCPVHRRLVQGDSISTGESALQVLETPGHSKGHLSFLLPTPDKTWLFSGDLVFWGGTIALQNFPDCNLTDYAESILKLAELDFDAFLPGHLSIALQDGKEHVERAAAMFRQRLVPRNFI
jgi:glyoxylase-like metal-dependent hydrolase (beta-lactamase superfamily II)